MNNYLFKKPFPNRSQSAPAKSNNANFKIPSSININAGQKRNPSQINESQLRRNLQKPKTSQTEVVNPLDLDQSVFNDMDFDHIEELIKSPPIDKKASPKTQLPGSNGGFTTPSPKRQKFYVLNMNLPAGHPDQEKVYINVKPSSLIKPVNNTRRILANDSTENVSTISGHAILSSQPDENISEFDEIPSGQPPNIERYLHNNSISVDTRDFEINESNVKAGGHLTDSERKRINDFFRTDDDADDNMIYSSQMLIKKARTMRDVEPTQTQLSRTPKNSTFVVVNKTAGSEYIRREKAILERNGENLIEDAIDSQKIDKYESSQFRREIDDMFEFCEKNIADMTNLIEASIDHRHDISGLDAINWDEEKSFMPDSPARQPSQNPSARKSYSPFVDRVGPVLSCAFSSKGPFFGLPTQVQNLFKEYRGIEELYDWQIECLKLGSITQRRNLIYALPTSGGKTLVAEIIMLREIICRQKNVIFVVPYVSIAQEKMAAISPFAVSLNFLVEEYSGGKGTVPPRKRRKKNSIFVCTIEKAYILFDSLVEAGRASEVGLIVVDELHMIGEERRGAILEMLLCKVLSCNTIQVVGMSATIGNLPEIADFLNADIYQRDFRPVELREFVKCRDDLVEINKNAKTMDELFTNKRTMNYAYSAEMLRDDPDNIVALVTEVIPEASCLIFCATKKNCEAVCAMLAKLLPKQLHRHRLEEKKELFRMLTEDGGNSNIGIGIQCGIAYHHSGLTAEERRTIEDAYRLGILSCIVCTSTLAAGVNLPAKRVIIRSPYIARDFITLGKYKQMVGRAGRAGFGEAGESVLICMQKDIDRLCQLLSSPMDMVTSTLHSSEGSSLFKQLLLSVIGLKIAVSRNAIMKFVTKTLLAVQSFKLGVNIRDLVDNTLKDLIKTNAVKVQIDQCLKTPANMTIEIDKLEETQELDLEQTKKPDIRIKRIEMGTRLLKTVQKNSPLEVNRLGQAAIKAGWTMEKTSRYYDELKSFGNRINVLDEIDLLYIILLDDNHDCRVYENEIAHLLVSEKVQDIALRFGITIQVAQKIIISREVPTTKKESIQRIMRLLIAYDLWNMKTAREIASIYGVDPGAIQALINNTAATASALLRMCEELPEFWAFKLLFTIMPQRLSHCCTVELLPLMDLPGVKIARAKQLYKSGFTKLQTIAKATPKELTDAVEYLPFRQAVQIIASAKAKLMEEVEALKEQVEDLISG